MIHNTQVIPELGDIPEGADEELVKEVINLVVALMPREVVGLEDINQDVALIEWCPVFTRDPSVQGGKCLSRLRVRRKGDKFVDITDDELTQWSMSLPELHTYLKRSDASLNVSDGWA